MSTDLLRFVANSDDPRTYLQAPWRAGKWVYSTNGHVCVRVPAASAPEITATPDKVPNAAKLFDKWFDQHEGEFLVMPPLDALRPCEDCKGTGKHFVVKCPDCDDGTFDKGYNTYTCLNCEDEACVPGWLVAEEGESTVEMPCDTCYGRGAYKDECRVGDSLFELVYMHWLAALPQARIRTQEDIDAPAAVLFDGGQALVMPLRRPNNHAPAATSAPTAPAEAQP